MRNLLLRFLINAVAIAVITSGLLPGIFIIGSMIPTIAVVALVFGLVNSLIRPIVRLLTCPFVLLTLGLFTFVINGAMLYLASRLSELTVNLTHGQVVIENFLLGDCRRADRQHHRRCAGSDPDPQRSQTGNHGALRGRSAAPALR